METLLSQDNSCAGGTETPYIKVDSPQSTINVVKAFKNHRLYQGWTLTEVISEMEKLASVSLEYADEDVLTVIRCLTEKAVELNIEGDGDLPCWTTLGCGKKGVNSSPHPKPVEIHQSKISAPDPEGILQA